MERSFKFSLPAALAAGAATLALTAAPAAAQTHVDVGVWLPNVGARVVVGSPPPVYVPTPVYAPVYAAPVYGPVYPVYRKGPGKRGRGWGPPHRAYAAPVYVERVYVDRYAPPRYRDSGRYRGYYGTRRDGRYYRQEDRRGRPDRSRDSRYDRGHDRKRR